jgi:segregation and condensation protein B
MNDRHQQLRLVEALLFASAEPMDEAALKARLPEDADLAGLLQELGQLYANRGVQLVQVGKRWAFRTAPELAAYLRTEQAVPKKLNRAGVETLAVIAYHQPITRPEIEEIRGVSLSRGTLDVLLEAGWIKPGKRKEGPGRPVTWVTTETFLDHFGLASIKDLPGIEELKAAGLLDKRPAIAAYGAALTEEQAAEQEAAREAELEEAEEAELSLEELELDEEETPKSALPAPPHEEAAADAEEPAVQEEPERMEEVTEETPPDSEEEKAVRSALGAENEA